MRKYCMIMLWLTSLGCWAQTDSTAVNRLSVDLNFLTHGEACGGGLPRSTNSAPTEDRSSFLYGRTRLIVDYERPGLQAHAVIQNGAVWGMKGNQSMNLYEGWVKLTAQCGLFAQIGRVALAYDDERIVGPNDFAMAAASHDIVRVGYEGHGHKAHVILAYWPTTRTATTSIQGPITTTDRSFIKPCRQCGTTTTCSRFRWAYRYCL